MSVHQMTVSLPESIYVRLQRTAQATRQTLIAGTTIFTWSSAQKTVLIPGLPPLP